MYIIKICKYKSKPHIIDIYYNIEYSIYLWAQGQKSKH